MFVRPLAVSFCPGIVLGPKVGVRSFWLEGFVAGCGLGVTAFFLLDGVLAYAFDEPSNSSSTSESISMHSVMFDADPAFLRL